MISGSLFHLPSSRHSEIAVDELVGRCGYSRLPPRHSRRLRIFPRLVDAVRSAELRRVYTRAVRQGDRKRSVPDDRNLPFLDLADSEPHAEHFHKVLRSVVYCTE